MIYEGQENLKLAQEKLEQLFKELICNHNFSQIIANYYKCSKCGKIKYESQQMK